MINNQAEKQNDPSLTLTRSGWLLGLHTLASTLWPAHFGQHTLASTPWPAHLGQHTLRCIFLKCQLDVALFLASWREEKGLGVWGKGAPASTRVEP